MTDDEAREDLRSRHATQIYREERRQKIEEIAQQEGIPIDLCIQSQTTVPDIVSLREELLRNNQEYLEKIELGQQVAAIIDKGAVREESLTKNYK